MLTDEASAVKLLREILNASEAGAYLPATDIRKRIRTYLEKHK